MENNDLLTHSDRTIESPRTEPKPHRNARRLNLHDVWARWAVRAATTDNPWAHHVAAFYRRLAHQETHYEP